MSKIILRATKKQKVYELAGMVDQLVAITIHTNRFFNMKRMDLAF